MKINIETASKHFDDHLELESNNRIFFSAQFGTGKSYFLKEYFKEKENDYNLFWITPVDYVVGANQDIFEWIKIDIAKELLSNHYKRRADKRLGNNLLIQTYVYSNVSNLFNEIASVILSKIGKNLTGVDVLDDFKKQFEDFRNYKKEQDRNDSSADGILANFLNESGIAKGSIFEDDLITQILRTAILQVKFETKKETVLVIDDLDRLDPEHIFRILNILSSHNTHFDTNKFGFDKVIVVGDVENIQHTYAHRYGKDCNFSGYMDKFYTYEPFNFTIKDAISSFCKKISLTEALDESNQHVLSYIVTHGVELGLINVRHLRKVFKFSTRKKLPSITYEANQNDVDAITTGFTFLANSEFVVDFDKYDFFRVLYILSVMCGGVKKLRVVIETLGLQRLDVKDEERQSIWNAVALPYHLTSTIHYPDSRCFYSLQSWNQRSRIQISFPQLYFLGTSGEIPLKWIKGNQYTGGNYFELTTPIFQSISYGRMNSSINWESLAAHITHIINFAWHHSFFENNQN